jgi:hypothetical protein
MILVRYLTLVALVLWLGVLADERFGDLVHRAHLLVYACGAVTVTGLFVMKFMGPPPRAFVLRAAIASLMLLLALGAAFAARDAANLLLTVDLGLGLILLIWYVRE